MLLIYFAEISRGMLSFGSGLLVPTFSNRFQKHYALLRIRSIRTLVGAFDEYITSVVCTRYFIDTRMRTKYQDQVLIESEISAGT